MKPADDAVRVGQILVGASDAQREILMESLDGRESGRTICNGDVLEPEVRDYRSVQVQACPTGDGGMMHGGGGHDFKAPTHSLVDMAIVLFHEPAASLVVGSVQSDLFYEPADTREAIRRFQDALGAEVSSAQEVTQVLSSGAGRPAPIVRDELRDSLSPLFETVPTQHGESQMATAAPVTDEFLMTLAAISDDFTDMGDRTANIAKALTVIGQSAIDFSPADAEVNIGALLIEETASALTLLLVARMIGNRQ